MNRLYVLITVEDGTAETVARSLQNRPGVMLADVIENPPDIMLIVQANSNQRLAELTIGALEPVENLIKELKLLPTSRRQKQYAMATPLAGCLN